MTSMTVRPLARRPWRRGHPPLHEYLGLTRDEYEVSVYDPFSLPCILQARQPGENLVDIMATRFEQLRVANRAEDRTIIFSLRNWLRRQRRISSPSEIARPGIAGVTQHSSATHGKRPATRPRHPRPDRRRPAPPSPRGGDRPPHRRDATASTNGSRRSSRTRRVFSRTLGETSDVVTKEMYTFDDRGGDSHHAAPGSHRRRLPRPGHQRPDPVAAAESVRRRPDVPLRAAAEGPLPPVPPDRHRADRPVRAARRRRGDRLRLGHPQGARRRTARRCWNSTRWATRTAGRPIARRWSRISPRTRPRCRRTAWSGWSAIRCASWTARTSGDRRI